MSLLSIKRSLCFFVTAQVNANFVLQAINVFIRLIPVDQRMFFTFPCYFKYEIQGKELFYFKYEIQGKELLYLKMVQELRGRKKRKRSIGMANIKYHQHLDTM